MENNNFKTGQYIYVINKAGEKFLRKLTFVGKNTFEYNFGWGEINQLQPNSNKKSKVKFTFNNF